MRDTVLDALLPPRCLHCGGVAREGVWRPLLCRDCAANLARVRDPIFFGPAFSVRAVFQYHGPARTLLHRLKYHGAMAVGARLARDMARELRGDCALVPVPLHWRRRWARGHNQAHTLARFVAQELPETRVVNALRRRRATRPQVGLSGPTRRVNLVGAFAMAPGCVGELRRCSAVLIDDVVTTGSTLLEAAAILRAHDIDASVAVTAAVSLPRDGG